MANGTPISGNTNTGSGRVPYPDYMSEMALGRRSKNTIDNLNYADLMLAMQKGNAGQVNPAIRDQLSSLTGQIPQGQLYNSMAYDQKHANMGSGTAGIPTPMSGADQAKMNYAPQKATSSAPTPNTQTETASNFTAGGNLQQAIEEQYASQLAAQTVTPTPISTKVDPSDDLTFVGGSAGGATRISAPVQGFTEATDQTATIEKELGALEGTIRDEFGNLVTKDFTEDIRNMIEEGRITLRDLNAEQLLALQEAEQRRIGQIGDIRTGLEGDLAQQEQYRRDIQQQVADQAAQRAGQMTADQQARVQASRDALGQQVTSEFEEVAALTGGLAGSQALSTTAGMDRLAQVANQGAAQRLAAPAMLAAEAEMAVGDDKFRIENQLRQQLSEGLAELNIQEQQQVFQEAMRQEEFGIQRDQAMANALMNVANQRATMSIAEQQRLDDYAIRQGEILQAQGFQAGEAQKQRDFQAQQASIARAAARRSEENRTAEQKQAIIDASKGAVVTAQKMGYDLSEAEAEAMIKAGTFNTWLDVNLSETERNRIQQDALELEEERAANELALFELENPNSNAPVDVVRNAMPDITDTALGWASQWYLEDPEEARKQFNDIFQKTDAMGNTSLSGYAQEELSQIMLAMTIMLDAHNEAQRFEQGIRQGGDPAYDDMRMGQWAGSGAYNTLTGQNYRQATEGMSPDQMRSGMK